MATMSNVFKTLGRIPAAMRSERRTSPLPLSAVVAICVFPPKEMSVAEAIAGGLYRVAGAGSEATDDE